jgi:hypothetical protein
MLSTDYCWYNTEGDLKKAYIMENQILIKLLFSHKYGHPPAFPKMSWFL